MDEQPESLCTSVKCSLFCDEYFVIILLDIIGSDIFLKQTKMAALNIMCNNGQRVLTSSY